MASCSLANQSILGDRKAAYWWESLRPFVRTRAVFIKKLESPDSLSIIYSHRIKLLKHGFPPFSLLSF